MHSTYGELDERVRPSSTFSLNAHLPYTRGDLETDLNLDMDSSPGATATTTTPPAYPRPTTYTLRCPWTVALPHSTRPPRVVANADQLVILNAMYARTGEDATKVDVEDVARETGLQEKWIRKWIKRQRNSRRGKGKGKDKGKAPSASVDPSSKQKAAQGQAADTSPLSQPGSSGDSLWGSPLQTDLAEIRLSVDSSSSGHGPISPTSEQSGPSNTSLETFAGSLTAFPRIPVSDVHPKASSVDTVHAAPIMVQVAHQGASFSLPLRPLQSSQQGIQSLHSAAQSLTPPAVQATVPPVSPDCLVSDFSVACSPLSIGYDTHGGSPQPSSLGTLCMPISPEALIPGLSATPSVFSLPLDPLNPAQLSTGSAYLYRMLHDSGEHSPPSDASAFNTTAHYLSDHVQPSAMRPDLWAPSATEPRAPGFMASAMPGPDSVGGDPAFDLPGTPVSFQMRMSDLIVLTRSVMGAVADGGLPPKTGTEDSSEAADAEAVRSTAVVQEPLPTSARAAFTREEVTAEVDVAMPDLVHSRGDIASGDESGDEEEVVTPCEEVQLDLGPHICSASPEHSANSIGGGLPEEDRDKGKAVEGTGDSYRRGPR